VVENETEEFVHLVDFEQEGSVKRRLWRMNVWRTIMLKSLFSW
jgi:hypothetical protein